MLTLAKLRAKVNKIDADIIKKLAAREKIVKKIGKLKANKNKPILSTTREKALFHYYENLCAQYHLSSQYVKRIFKIIIVHSRKVQKNNGK